MGKASKTNSKLLEKLLKEREDLLSTRPELRPLQVEIDERLAEVGEDPIKRIQVIHDMLDDIIKNELRPSVKELHEAVDKYVKLQVLAETDRTRKKRKKTG